MNTAVNGSHFGRIIRGIHEFMKHQTIWLYACFKVLKKEPWHFLNKRTWQYNKAIKYLHSLDDETRWFGTFRQQEAVSQQQGAEWAFECNLGIFTCAQWWFCVTIAAAFSINPRKVESAVRAIRCQSFASDRQDLSLYVKRLTSGISAPPIRTEHQATKNRHFASFQIITVPTWRGLGNHMILCSRKWRDSNHCIPWLYFQHEKTVF